MRREVFSAGEFRRAVEYTWEANDRLRMVVDATRGPVRYQHDALGNLAAATYEDGRVDLRLPDAVGNLFRAGDRGDRKYGPAGQLLESREPDGRIVNYEYDAEGNLAMKLELDPARGDARVWTYHWNGAGMLVKVVRPDGEAVEFTYDALARRLSKTFRGRTTRWIWDGNVPLHEWVEARAGAAPAGVSPAVDTPVLDELAARRRRAERSASPAQGPPGGEPLFTSSPRPYGGSAAPSALPSALPPWSAGATEPGTAAEPITWLFDPESFAPMAKLVGDAQYAILTDHLGTPTAMYDATGAEVWSATIDAYGDLRHLTGKRQACPFRWPGQYEDPETGLYYNRFRYYDPQAGQYLAVDPLRVWRCFEFYKYVDDPLGATDPLGLAEVPNMVRVQIQRGNANLASVAIEKTSAITAVEVEKAMIKAIQDLPAGERGLIPAAHGAAAQLSKKLRGIVKGGGISDGGNILREWLHGGEKVRFDVENRGSNLKSCK